MFYSQFIWHFLLSLTKKQNCIQELADLQSNQSAPQPTSTVNSNIEVPVAKLVTDKLPIFASKPISKGSSNRSSSDASRRKSNTNSKSSGPTAMANLQRKENSGLSINKNAFVSPAARSTIQPPISSQSNNLTNSSPPQSVAVVAGRKYIMVPKKNLTSSIGSATANGIPHVKDVSQL